MACRKVVTCISIIERYVGLFTPNHKVAAYVVKCPVDFVLKGNSAAQTIQLGANIKISKTKLFGYTIDTADPQINMGKVFLRVQ